MEPLRSNRIITCWFTYAFKGDIFIIIYVFINMNPLFQELSSVIKVELTLSISLFKTQLQIIQSDFKSEYLFRTCSVDTYLVTSLKISFRLLSYYVVPFWPTMEQFRIYSFHSFRSTATSNATSEYVTVPERLSKNEEQNSRKKERTSKTLSSSPNTLQTKRSKLI